VNETDEIFSNAFSFDLLFLRLVVGAAVVHLVNILVLLVGTRDREVRSSVAPAVEEKTNGAIMLY
jgi:hypothetical protein